MKKFIGKYDGKFMSNRPLPSTKKTSCHFRPKTWCMGYSGVRQAKNSGENCWNIPDCTAILECCIALWGQTEPIWLKRGLKARSQGHGCVSVSLSCTHQTSVQCAIRKGMVAQGHEVQGFGSSQEGHDADVRNIHRIGRQLQNEIHVPGQRWYAVGQAPPGFEGEQLEGEKIIQIFGIENDADAKILDDIDGPLDQHPVGLQRAGCQRSAVGGA